MSALTVRMTVGSCKQKKRRACQLFYPTPFTDFVSLICSQSKQYFDWLSFFLFFRNILEFLEKYLIISLYTKSINKVIKGETSCKMF